MFNVGAFIVMQNAMAQQRRRHAQQMNQMHLNRQRRIREEQRKKRENESLKK